jgi:hypothetical protein
MVSSATPSSSRVSRMRPVKASICTSRSARLLRLVEPANSGSGIGGMWTWV